MAELNITNIPAPRVPFVDERTGLMAREWYRFFLNLFVLTGSGNNPITLEELQLGPPNQPDLAELLIQINQNIAPQYEDQSGDFLATLDTAQLMSMMSRFENAEAAIQGAYLQPVVQTGTIANYNLDGSPTAGGVAYGTGPALAVSAAGTLGQVLTSAGAGTPTWAAAATGTVTSVSVVSANGLAGTVATATTTPAITLSTTVTGLLKGNGTAISAATSGTDYAPATSGTSILYGDGAGGFNNVAIGTGVTFSSGTLSATGSGGTVTSVAALTLGTTGTDLSSTVANGTTTPVITLQVPTASAANRGALSAADWTTFNSKQPAGSYLVSGGALGTPSSGTVTNLTGTASININGTVGATTAAAGKFTTLGVTALITSTLTSGEVMKFGSTTSGTGIIYMDMFNTSGGMYLGIEGSAGGSLWTNIPAYATALGGRSGGGGISFSANAVTQHMLLTTTGLAITGTLSATGVVTFSNYGVGSATFNASGVISSVSDETWKIKDGAPADPDAMLKKLEAGYWYYNDEKKEIFGKDRQLGFYAQNVNAAIGPEAAPEPESYISQDEEGNEITVKKPWGYYDRSVLAVTVLSLQKALATIESLTARIAALEAK